MRSRRAVVTTLAGVAIAIQATPGFADWYEREGVGLFLFCLLTICGCVWALFALIEASARDAEELSLRLSVLRAQAVRDGARKEAKKP